MAELKERRDVRRRFQTQGAFCIEGIELRSIIWLSYLRVGEAC